MKSNKPGTLRMTVKNVCPKCSRSALYAVSQNCRPKQDLLVLPGPKNPYINTTQLSGLAFKQSLLHSSSFSLLASSPCMARERTSVLLSRDFSPPPNPQWRSCSQSKVRLLKQITTKPQPTSKRKDIKSPMPNATNDNLRPFFPGTWRARPLPKTDRKRVNQQNFITDMSSHK